MFNIFQIWLKELKFITNVNREFKAFNKDILHGTQESL